MAKSALVVVLALVLIISIQFVVGDDIFSQEQVDKFTSNVKDAAQNVAENVEDTSSSWSSWAKEQLRDFGLLSPKEIVSAGSASAPENAPASGYSSSYESEPAATPSY
ncbi:hypothetical protein PTKIN_Ptkin13bG0007700 [Pterospermum kingtungense]